MLVDIMVAFMWRAREPKDGNRVVMHVGLLRYTHFILDQVWLLSGEGVEVFRKRLNLATLSYHLTGVVVV